MAARLVDGVWLGNRFSYEEHVVALASGKVVRSGTIRPLPESDLDVALSDGI